MASRTLYITIISFFTLALLSVFAYFSPEKIYQSEVDNLRDRYEYSLSVLSLKDSSEFQLLRDQFRVYLNDPVIWFVLISSAEDDYFIDSGLNLNVNDVKQLPSEEVVLVKGQKVLIFNFNFDEDLWSGLHAVRFGVRAEQALNAYNNSRDFFILLLIISIFCAGTAVFLFEKFLRKPLSEIIVFVRNYRKNEAGDVDTFTPQGLLEIRFLAMEIIALINRLDSPGQDEANEAVEEEVNKNNEIDPTSSLAQMPLELKHETSKDYLLEKANELITERYQFHLSMIYLKEGPVYRFHSSHLKGMKILNDKLSQSLKGEVLSDEVKLLKKLNPFRPHVTSLPHFDQVLDTLNLRGNFVYHPLAADGMLIIGYLDEQTNFSEADLKRTMAMANYIVLSLIDQESINRLRQQIKIKTNELEAANDMLATSIKNKDMMLKLISHDLRAPLRNVYGLIDSIQRKFAKQLHDDMNARLERIRNNITKELTMINDILENFKAVEKSDTLIPVQVNQIIQNIQNDLQYELDKKKVILNRLETYPVIYSDPYVVEHIFLNLIDNACKYFESNTQNNQINIGCSETHSTIDFQVIDNGSGIPKDKYKQIDAYFRGKHDDLPKNTSGVGLGLALTKNLVDRINGQIHVKSQSGQGCVFTVVFNKINLDASANTNQQGWN